MKKTLIVIVLGVFLISLSTAMYSGETETFDMGFEIINCSIINNTYDLEGLNLTWNDTNVTMETVSNYQPDNFSISCWVKKYGGQADVSVRPSGASGNTIYPKDVPKENITDTTDVEDVVDPPKIVDTPSDEEKSNAKVLIKALIIVLSILCIWIVIYVVWLK